MAGPNQQNASYVNSPRDFQTLIQLISDLNSVESCCTFKKLWDSVTFSSSFVQKVFNSQLKLAKPTTIYLCLDSVLPYALSTCVFGLKLLSWFVCCFWRWCFYFDVVFSEITSLPVVECMLRFAACPNTRLSNLATVFLEVSILLNKCLLWFQ